MRAARISSYGGPEVLQLVDVDPPAPGPGEVVVEVRGSSVNPADVAVRNGWMAQYLPMELPLTLGIDVAGVVTEVGPDVAWPSVGEEVYGVAGVMMGAFGAYAERALTRPELLAVPPKGLDLVTAGTLPLVGVSAIQAIEANLEVGPGTRLFVHGAAGGVGPLATALARHLGAHVVASCRGGLTNIDHIGADQVVDTDDTDVLTLGPFDASLDLVGSDPTTVLDVTRPQGRAVSLIMPPDPERAAAKQVTAMMQAGDVTTARLHRLRELVESGILTPLVTERVPLDDIAKAFEIKAAGGVRGKIAITIG